MLKNLPITLGVAKIGGQIMGNTPDVTVSDLEHQIAKTITETLVNSSFQDITVSLNKALKGIGSELVNRFADKGIIGVNYGDEGSYKGVGINYEDWKAAISQIMGGLSNLDITQLTSVFNYIRENLTSTLNNFIKQESQVDSKIQALTQKIEENAKTLGVELRSRKSLSNSLSDINKKIKETESKLNELSSRKSDIKRQTAEFKPTYEDAKGKFSEDYYKLKKEADELLASLKKVDATSPEYKSLSKKYNEKQKQLWDNPWLGISNQYEGYKADLIPINAEIKKATSSLEQLKESAKKYEDSIKKLDNLTKEEKTARTEQAKALREENKELRESIKELKVFKEELKSKQSDAKKELNNSDNYKSVYDVIRGNLVPLTNRIFANGEKQIAYDKIEHSAERVADSAESKKNQDILSAVSQDLKTGFNTDVNSDKIASLLEQIRDSLQSIGGKGGKRTGKSLSQNEIKEAYNIIQKAFEPIQKALPSADRLALPSGKKLDRSTVMTSVMDPSKSSKLKSAFNKLFGITEDLDNYEKIMSKSSKEQDKLNAQRIKRYGINSNRFPAETGDKSRIYRSLALWRGRDKFSSMFPDFKTTPGVKVDTTAITKAVAEVLSGPEMFKAQTGGWKNNLMAAGTGGLAFLWQPSLEKTRAQADAVNTMMADVRENIQAILQDILNKESILSAMEEQGDIKYNSDGSVAYGTPEAKMTAAQLEESKEVLASLLADVGKIDEVVANTGGKLDRMVKQLGFTAPLLRKDNMLLANINAGLDKSGKAFKFQKRYQEILNYSFQLMGRHIGQIFKRLMLMLNPINLIKKAFSDFASYDVKWQRTMNVIKYNIRRVIRPFMEWVAQQLVNLIGLANAFVKGIGKAFGYNWDLFDQAAANTEKMREEMEAAANVTAGFDELHDIGSDNSAAGDLMGDIYTPQWDGLNQAFENLGEMIGGSKIVQWIGEHPLETAAAAIGAVLFGPMLIKGAATLLKNGLKALFGGNAIKETATAGGSLLGNIFGKTLYTGMNGQIVTVGKLLGGLALTAGGTAIAVSNAIDTGANWEDLSNGAKVAKVALSGVASVAAGLGAIMLGASGPVGWAVAGGVALTSFAAGMFQVQDGIGSVKDEQNKLIETQKIATEVNNAYLQSTNNLAQTMAQLETLETQTGLSGAELAKQVDNGTLSVESMTSAQIAVYNAYLQNQKAIENLKEITKQKKEADHENELQALKTAAANAIESKSYDELREKVVTAWRDGSISAQEAGNILSRTLANADEETRRTFGDSIPKEIKAAFDPGKYESGWNKFGKAVEGVWTSIINGFSNFGKSIEKWWTNLWGGNQSHNPSSASGYGGGFSAIAPKMATGTNYVPNDGLFYLHQGEAVVPKKYNQPYNQGMSNEERAYMQQMMATMKSLDGTMKQGIVVNGQFVQRGSDLVAVVNKTKSQTGSDLLSNVAYAR